MRKLATLACLLWTGLSFGYEIPADSPIAEALKQAETEIATIVAVPADERNFANTLGAYDDMLYRLQTQIWYPQIMAYLSTDPEARERGRTVSEHEANWMTELSTREDLYGAVKALAERSLSLDPVQQRYLDQMLRDYRRAGMELSEDKRERYKAIQQELTKLGLEFDQNINEDGTRVRLTAEELAGVPDGVMQRLERDKSGDLYQVQLDYSVYLPIMRYCTNEITRHKMYLARRREGGQRNVDKLHKILRLRAELAHLLGYKNTAQYQLEIKMAKNVQAVWDFYDKLIPLVHEKAEVDFAELQAEKRAHTGDPDTTLQAWDQSFYETRLLRDRYQVDRERLREYFPLDAVIGGVFMISNKLYGLKFDEVTDQVEQLGLKPVWHDDVQVYEVRDTKDNSVRGYLYFDLFPREAKDTGAWQWGVTPYKQLQTGEIERPVIVVNCNFTPPDDERPSLLDHTEVVTFFHEFGHVLHTLLSDVPYYRFSGTEVARDFVEVPSQMFENWAWDRDVLKQFARHYKTGAPLPDDLLDAALKARNFCSGMQTLAQFWLGMTDMRYHTDPDGNVDTTKIGNDTYTEVTLYTAPPNTFFEAGFGHLLGYQAGYYSYMWGLVYAQDIASKMHEMGMLSPAAGQRLRETILSRGGTVDESQMLHDFLGREPRMDAFLEHLGLESPLH